MPDALFLGRVILPSRVIDDGAVGVRDGRIAAAGPRETVEPLVEPTAARIDAGDGYLAPGYVDLHVHGGAGADFMDATAEAFRTVLGAHARHGTTSLVPTTTVARHEQLLAVLELVRQFRRTSDDVACARVLGAHFYGPYFSGEAKGCHPGRDLRPPDEAEYNQYLEYSDAIVAATVAPELPGAGAFARACVKRGVRVNLGHSQATFDQAAAAVEWGARHVDHLYCAMSDKTKLRQKQPYPMRGGLLEATFFFDELSTEVIADGKHLTGDLLRLALKIKGRDRLALVTDCNRALDMPEGRYLFGPLDGGEPFEHRDGVGVMPDGQGLASATQGMDHMVRTFVRLTGSPLWEAVRMASLTPARIAGWDREVGSLEPGKQADLLVLAPDLTVQRVFLGGREILSTGHAASLP